MANIVSVVIVRIANELEMLIICLLGNFKKKISTFIKIGGFTCILSYFLQLNEQILCKNIKDIIFYQN